MDNKYKLTDAIIQQVVRLDVGWQDYSGLIILNRHFTYSDDLLWWVTRGTPVLSPYRLFMLREYNTREFKYSATLDGDEAEFLTDMTALRLLGV